jgi:catechol 2,3-dioxygenase-like lactoylglutathione lyase family enzyme
MARFQSINPCFPVADVAATIRWYEQHLGFTGDPFPQHEPFVFGILRRDGVEIMLQRVPGYEKPNLYDSRSGGVWDAYLRIRGINELYEAVKHKLDIKQPLRKQPYDLWEFEVMDLNGYILVFSEFLD